MLCRLTDQEWEDFLNKEGSNVRSFSKGQIIYLEGDLCQSADFIVYGTLYVKRHDAEGRTFMIERFKAGDMIGANLLFSSESVYPMTIIAETDCEIIAIKKSQLLEWCQHNILFLTAYLNEISDKTKVLVKAVKKISTGTLREKLVIHFEEIHRIQTGGMSLPKEPYTIRLKVTKKELSERFGVARTSLSRELKRMEEDGIIELVDSRTIRVNNL